MAKNKALNASPDLWYSYAVFLMNAMSPPAPARARSLLPRATQSVPSAEHRRLTSKFGSLEFKSPNGDAERGRTIFEGLVSTWPNKGDLWDMYVELEKSHGDAGNVRALFERMSKLHLKKRRAANVFRKWAAWESERGDATGVQRVQARETEWLAGREHEET